MSDLHKTVAVIDDDPEIRAAMATIISAYGYDVETFDSAETFLTCVSTCKATCLLVDIQLRDISGVKLAHQLAANSFKFPIIFMTGCDNPMVESQAVAAGGIAFLRKPFSARILIDAIKTTIGAN
jgi:FixJ family two-component response regulator